MDECIEFLRNLYASCGLSIRLRTKLSKIEQLKLMIEAWGMNPNETLIVMVELSKSFINSMTLMASLEL